MHLIEINKQSYKQRLNNITIAIVALLVVASLSISQCLIALFPAEQGSHFHWNLLGVICSLFIASFILIKLKKHPYFYEVSYVWELKKILNQINRYLPKIEKAAQQGDANAMQILHFSYLGSRQVWQLDNNTLTLSQLTKLEEQLQQLALTHQVELDSDKFHIGYLKVYKK